MCMLCQARDPSIEHYDSHGNENFADGSTTIAAAKPVFSYDQIADYLTTGFWDDRNTTTRHFDVQTGGTITYNLDGLTSGGAAMAVQAFDAWSAVSGLNFEATSSGSAQMMFDDNNSGAYASSIVSGGHIIRSDINIHTSWADYGSYYFQTFMHEIGHALGLGHTGNYNGSATYDSDAGFANDSWQTSIMSYFSQGQNTWTDATRLYLSTLQLGDIAAIQQLYGAPTSIETGDTVYGDNHNTGRFGMDLSSTLAAAIVDNGGTDLIDLGSRSDNQMLNLNEETYSNINGRVGNFSIGRGTVIENVITGRGNDQIFGNGADNRLESGGGADVIVASGGSDTLVGGVGADTLTGGTGADHFVYEGLGGAGDTITDFSLSQGDRVDVTSVLASIGYDGSDPVADGVLTLQAEGGGSWLTVNYNGISTQLAFLDGIAATEDLNAIIGTNDPEPEPGPTPDPEPASVDTIYAIDSAFIANWSGASITIEDRDGGIDTIDLSTLDSPSVVSLESGVRGRVDDRAFYVADGTVVEHLVFGGGDDRGFGNGQANILVGNAGADRLYGEGGDDTLSGGLDNDLLFGGSGHDVMTGGAGIDRLYGDDGNDSMDGGADNDQLFGAAGNDTLSGGSGNDRIYGGSGDNVLDGGEGSDRLYGAEGNDDISGGTGDNRIIGGGGNDTITALDGNDQIRTGDGNDSIDAGNGHNRIYGFDGDNVITSGDGDDRIYVGAGHDLIAAGDGNNSVTSRHGNNRITTGTGNDSIRLGGGDDTVEAGGGANRVRTGAGNDIISTGNGDDRIAAGEGNDVIDARDGNNTVSGDGGNDLITTGMGADRVRGGDGDDTINAGGGDNRVMAGEGANVVRTGAGNDNIRAGGGADNISAGDGDNRIVAMGGNDHITTGAGADRVNAGTGNDFIDAGAGDDILRGDLGHDTINAGDGNDRVYADRGEDVVDGGAGNDRIHGGYDNDILDGGSGADTLYGENGDDIINGGADSDIVRGGLGHDTLAGDAGDDTIRGDNGDDVLDGGEGADWISAGAGNDTISGGAGADILFGGDGADVFVFDAIDGFGDVIRDLNWNRGDRIDINSLLAGFSMSVDTAINSGDLFLRDDGSSAWLSFDHDGNDSSAAFDITLLYRIDSADVLSVDWFVTA